ncbi:MAG: ABC transporter substrate-binding protein [Rhizobiales bacterium]|nr:ABC transporter substrate-binding protein [Hyphomicrobiales bacterium]
MSDREQGAAHRPSRRGVLGMAIAAILAASPAVAAAEHPSLVYMRQIARDLLNANRQGTVASFRSAILRYADVADIANYSLGQYKESLPLGQRRSYYDGVATFIARYFAEQSRQYRIAKYELGEPTTDGKDVLISSKVYVLTGQTYTVIWRLSWRGGRYKVTDAKILGFSMVYMQRSLFTSFLNKRDGKVQELVAALNR